MLFDPILKSAKIFMCILAILQTQLMIGCAPELLA